jgi:hypothetical protein
VVAGALSQIQAAPPVHPSQVRALSLSGSKSTIVAEPARNRGFITLLGGAAVVPVASPLAARAHVPGEDKTLMKALLERLQELGYSDGTNMSIKNQYAV